MRKLKQLCIATVLTLSLSCIAFAGDMDTPGITPPPPPNQPSITGDMHTTGVTSETSNSETTAIDSVTGLALYIFNSMTSVL
jgi:hypothetical protein